MNSLLLGQKVFVLRAERQIRPLNVQVVDNMPSGLTFSGTGIATEIWNLGDLKPGQIKSLDFLVDIDDNIVAGNYENIATLSADNHETIFDTAVLEVRTVEVKGIESPRLPETGFSVSEMVYLLVSLLMLFGISGVTRKQLKAKRQEIA